MQPPFPQMRPHPTGWNGRRTHRFVTPGANSWWARRYRERMAGPLAGITVVALEQAVAAPMCSRTLADFGARVIKVERPDGGDFARGYDDVVNGLAAHFVWV